MVRKSGKQFLRLEKCFKPHSSSSINPVLSHHLLCPLLAWMHEFEHQACLLAWESLSPGRSEVTVRVDSEAE
jgi:hypothetical protein